MKKCILYIVLLGLLALCATPVRAMTESDLRQVHAIEYYLNRIDTLVADFVQVAPNGSLASGKFFLDRPGRLRWQYDPPTPILIVARDDTLTYYDYELEEVSRIDIEETLAGFLARKHIEFETKDTRLASLSAGAGVVRATLERRNEPESGSLTLVFMQEPLTLRKLEVADGDGKITHISLNRLQFDLPLEEELFIFRNPHQGQGRRGRN